MPLPTPNPVRRLSRLKDYFFPQEFVVDERPLPVYSPRPERIERPRRRRKKRSSAPPPAPPAEVEVDQAPALEEAVPADSADAAQPEALPEAPTDAIEAVFGDGETDQPPAGEPLEDAAEPAEDPGVEQVDPGAAAAETASPAQAEAAQPPADSDVEEEVEEEQPEGQHQPPSQRDLLTQMTELLAEQARLELKTRQLEMNAGAGDDEFGRFVRQLLPFVDNYSHLLDMAREQSHDPELDAWLRNIEALYFRIIRLLEDFGLRFISSVGKQVDLDYQEVVEYRRTDEYPHNTVIRELQKGAVFRGKLLRDAKVVVACNE
ncbi:MAG TPA: nucleotide exchange factor GrpE [Candidatus Sumerlaeota bacterium]|nr:nucleotide exchange factor GrpE [Candidatus Sumerlaeota bacterium]